MSNQPDLVLMDVCLDGGREGIKAGRWLREVCLLSLSLVTMIQTPSSVSTSGAGAPVLPKPVYREGVADAVAEMIGHGTL